MKVIKRLCIGLSMGLALGVINAKVSWGQISPYGASVNRYNAQAYSATQKGDYDTAIINYRRAMQAAQALNDPLLRDCGVASAMANVRGAEAAKAYLKEQGVNPTNLRRARDIEDISFRAYWDEIDVRRPDLANSCP
ncbi:MAG: hypothetical protein ACXITR_00285 [Cyanobacterium sp.]